MTDKKPKRKPRSYTDEFKQQLVLLYQNGKRNRQLEMENDILKQAALILGRK